MTIDEVLEACDNHREIQEGVGLSDELIRIVTFAYEQGCGARSMNKVARTGAGLAVLNTALDCYIEDCISTSPKSETAEVWQAFNIVRDILERYIPEDVEREA